MAETYNVKILCDGKTIDNSKFRSSFTFENLLMSSDVFSVGECNSNSFKITILNEGVSYKGKTIKVTAEGYASNNVGTFVVAEDKLTSDKKSREIVAYDRLHDLANTDVSEWYNSLFASNTSVTLLQFRNSLFQHLGIEQEIISLINDSMLVEKTIDSDEMYASDVISKICEVNACFGKINSNNNFEYIYLSSTKTNKTITRSDVKACEYEDYSVEKITKLQIRKEDNDIGVIVGTGTNCYVIQDNFLLYGKDAESLSAIGTTILNSIKDITYIPMSVSCQNKIDVKVGDNISVQIKDKIIQSVVLQKVLSGKMVIDCSFKATGKQFQNEQSNKTHNSIKELKGKTNVLKRTIEELSVTITDKEKGLSSRIEQNSSSIETEVKRAKSAEENLSTKITQTDDKITLEVKKLQQEIDGDIKTYNVSYVPTLENYPAWDFTYNIPCNDTVKISDTLKFEYKDEYYSKNARSVAFNETTFVTYKFIKDSDSGQWYWREVADSDLSFVMQQYSELKIDVDSISAEVAANKKYVNGQIDTLSSKITQTATDITTEVTRATKAEGNLSSKITQTAESISSEVTRATKAEDSLSSKITQTAESITTEVSRAQGAENYLSSKIEQTALSIRQEVSNGYATKASLELKIDKSDNGQIISMINASANEINLKGNRISIVSDYFTLEHSGRITAVSGNIGGWDIASNGIVKESQYGKVLLQADGTLAMIDNSNNVKWALQCDGNFNLPGTASVGSVDALSARIGTIEANYITAGTVSANYATIGELNATNAVVSGKLSTSNLYSEIANLDFISVKGLWHAGHHISPLSISVNGVIRKVLAYDQ